MKSGKTQSMHRNKIWISSLDLLTHEVQIMVFLRVIVKAFPSFFSLHVESLARWNHMKTIKVIFEIQSCDGHIFDHNNMSNFVRAKLSYSRYSNSLNVTVLLYIKRYNDQNVYFTTSSVLRTVRRNCVSTHNQIITCITEDHKP